jgi:hypothetical protein
MLRRRLTRRGVALSSAGLAFAIAQEATARVPASLASCTVKAATLFAAGNLAAGVAVSTRALTLAHGALNAIPMGKSFAFAATLCTVTTLGGGVLYAHRERATAAVEVRSMDAASSAISQQAPPAAPQEPKPSKAADAKEPKGAKAAPDALQEGKRFGFGRGFGISRDSAAASATFNSGEASDSVNVNVTGSRKLALLTLPAVQRELALSVKQQKQVLELQKKQDRALQAVAPREPSDARDASRVLREVKQAAKKVRSLAKEIDQAIDELLDDKQRRQLDRMMTDAH